jgi:hypothetical protein
MTPTILQRREGRGAVKRHNNKLSPKQVVAIRQQYATGLRTGAPGPTLRTLAAIYGVTKTQVQRIVRYVQWRDL